MFKISKCEFEKRFTSGAANHTEAQNINLQKSQILYITNTKNIENMKNMKNKIKIVKLTSFVLLSLFAIFGIVFIGLTFIPRDTLFAFDDFERDSGKVLSAMGKHIVSRPLFTFSVWLLPIPFATFIPLWATEGLSDLVAIVLSLLAWTALLSSIERQRFTPMLMTIPESGYMWYETVVISLTVFAIRPFSFWLQLAGPTVSVCSGPKVLNLSESFIMSKLYAVFFVTLAVTSIIFVLPTVAVFIGEDETFYLLGYTTESIIGNVWSIGFILIWIRTYHIVCRDAYTTFHKYESLSSRICAILWIILGTALVEIWVSSAWTLHFAYTLLFDLEAETSFWKLERVQKLLVDVSNTGRRCCGLARHES